MLTCSVRADVTVMSMKLELDVVETSVWRMSEVSPDDWFNIRVG